MNETVTNIIGLYAGLILLNVVVASLMWWTNREILQRDLLVGWTSLLVAFVAQAITAVAFPNDHLVIVLGFATVFGVTVAFSRLVSRLFEVAVPLRAAIGGYLIALVLVFAAAAARTSFPVMASPLAIAVAFPLLVTAGRAIRLRWRSLNLISRALLLSCIAIASHPLDYPFLRMVPEYTAMGFTIAIGIVFALSIFAPAVVLEVLTSQQARVSAELDVAHRIQMKVLPREPVIPGLEVSCYMKPAEKVGGDYYDIYTLGDHSWILVGDVTGHGLSSGLVMLMAQSILASILHTRSEISPRELNFLANRILYQNLRRLEDLRSMTIIALCRVGDRQEFVFSGNHDHLFIYRARTRQVEGVDVNQLPHDLGFLNEFPLSDYGESRFRLEPGDLMLLATDGIVEASSGGSYLRGMFERERVVELLRQIGDRPLSEIKRRLLDELDAFTGGVYHDDVTFVLARHPTAA